MVERREGAGGVSLLPQCAAQRLALRWPSLPGEFGAWAGERKAVRY